MPQESQHTEWKASWHDDYLRWVCGFANAEGGRLEIGRNDRGEIVGVADAAKLLEDLPNKIRDVLGILVAVNLHEAGGKAWLEIIVDSYPNPINLRGRYYQRSGSTLQELKGAALDRFLLSRHGRTWDGTPVPGIDRSALSADAFRRFRELAGVSGRLNPTDLRASNGALLAKLKLLDGIALKRAAVLLFHPQPSGVVAGAFVKIGYFRSEGDVAYHDLIEGHLFEQVDRTIDLLRTKYLKAAISYAGLQRIERFPVPYAALRETVLNALVHRDYAVGAPVQIRVSDDKLQVWNPAVLPEGWTLSTLLREHASVPFNPDIAETFFRCGEIEAWGAGISRIFAACREAGTPEPQIAYEANGLRIEFPFDPAYLAATTSITTPITTPIASQSRILELVAENPTITQPALAKEVGLSVDGIKYALNRLKEEGLIRRTGPSRGGSWEIVGDKEISSRAETPLAGGRWIGEDSNSRSDAENGPGCVGNKRGLNPRRLGLQPESRLESQLESALAARVLFLLREASMGKAEIAAALGQKSASGELHKQVRRLVADGLLEYTLPKKPTSRLQRYRLTAAGRKMIRQTSQP